MGSSMKKKRDKKKDFQKPKLKVGKARAKADNFTDTSFKAKSIVVNQQSLTTSAPSSASQFAHYLSLASSSKSDTQRRDALSYLTTQLSSQPVNAPPPLPIAMLLPKLLPLIIDGTSSVRKQLLKLFHLLPASDIGDRVDSILLYTRAGMTHLASEIRMDALNVLEWLLEVAQEDVVSCPGGWVKTLKSFVAMVGWAKPIGSSKWTSASKASFGNSGNGFHRQLLVFSKFLKAGLEKEEIVVKPINPISILHMMLPTRSHAFAHLNLFGPPRDEEGEMYIDRADRQRVFQLRFRAAIDKGMIDAKKAAGEAGRAAAILSKIVKIDMEDFSGAEDTQPIPGVKWGPL